jgi:hypothetical protein
MLVRSLLQFSKGIGFSPDFSTIDAAQLRKVLTSGREVIRMILEDDPETEDEFAAELWDKAHTQE